MADALRVGIIGANAERGWAREAHVPAVQGVDGLELIAVATRSQESADAAAAEFGVDRAYGDPAELIADPNIDIVTVAASVPAHHDLITAALQAGKHVVTEWPVGTSTAETERLAELADRSGLHTAVGLQARLNPAAVRAGELLSDGTVGRVLSATVYSTTAGFGPVVGEGELYLEDPATGMNLITIQLAHTVDFAILLAGGLTSVAALTTIQYPDLAVGEPPRQVRRTIADHVLVQGRLADGGALSVQVVGGRPMNDTPFRFDIVGDNGVLSLTGGALRGFQSGLLELSLNGEPVAIDRSELAAPVVNVAGVYAALRDDLANGTRTAPSFADALRLSHLVDDLQRSATDRRTVTPSADWPH